MRDDKGKWDALDKLDDKPEANETIFVYQHEKTTGTAFVDGRDPKTWKRWGRVENIAIYRFREVKPDDATMRDNTLWSKWCHEQPEAERYKEKKKLDSAEPEE